jgi:putative cardiolipin synthase
VDINTEMGMFLESPALASQFATKLEADLPPFTYRLFLDESGRIRWRYEANGDLRTFATEPDTSFWRRFSAGFYRLFPLEDQL